MDEASKLRMQRLADALDAFVAIRKGNDASSADDLLRERPELRDVLEPMLVRAPEGAPDEATAGERVLGDFRLLREIGRGGMAVVFEAEQLSLRRRVALKVLPEDATARPESVLRFRREAAAAARLAHPGIAQVFAVGEDRGTHFFAMELVEGAPLDRVLARFAGEKPDALDGARLGRAVEALALRVNGGAPASGVRETAAIWSRSYSEAVCRIAMQVADALEHAHRAGIVHRDVKPSNVLVRPDGTALLTDFGLARDLSLVSRTQTGTIAGTPCYLAPEQIQGGRGALDARTDVYALGVTLYELVTLVRPFDGESPLDVLPQILAREPVDPAKRNPRLAPDLGTIVLKAMEKDPARRYASAAALAADLRAFLEYRPIAARRASSTARVLRWAKREPAKAALAGVLLLGAPSLLALGGYALAKQPEIRAAGDRARLERLERTLEQGYQWIDEDAARAAARFRDALAIEPMSPEAIAGLCFATLDPNARLAVLDAHPEAEASSGSVLRRVRARALRDAKRAAEAAALERELGPPLDPLERFVAGRASMPEVCATAPRGEFREALALFELAVASAPSARRLYHAEWAHAAGHAADPAHARAAADAIESLWPRSSSAWSSIGLALGRVDRARAAAAHRRAIELDPANGRPHSLAGDDLRDAGDAEGAVAEFRRAIELEPGRSITHLKLGSTLDALARWPEAVAEYRRAIEIEPTAPLPFANLGLTLRKSGDRAGAIAAYRSALALDPAFALAHGGLAQTLHESGELVAAIAEYRRSLELDPKDPDVQFNFANALWQSNELEAAEAAYRRALELVPDDAAGHAYLSQVLLAEGDGAAAVAEAVRATELDPKGETGWTCLGIALTAASDLDGAVAAFRRAAELVPNQARNAFNLGKTLVDAHELDEGVTVLRRAVELDPGMSLARSALDDAERSLASRPKDGAR